MQSYYPSSRLLAPIGLLCFLSLLARPAGAQITVGGDPGQVSPADPATWADGTTYKIGIDPGLTGSVTVAGGSSVSTKYSLAYLGSGAGSSGTVTVTDPGSTWTNLSGLYVGSSGDGTLVVANGGTVSCSSGYVGRYAGSSGTAIITGVGSTWTSYDLFVGNQGTGTLTVENGGTVITRTLHASPNDLKGDGTINVNGLDSDMDLIFDAAHGDSPSLSFGTGGTLNLSPDLNGLYQNLRFGLRGTGTLRIADSVTVQSGVAALGYYAGSTGTAVVTGPGSLWASSSLTVGMFGTGSLTVENGGTVTAAILYASPSDLKGNGTINAAGLVSDMDLVFDATHGNSQALSFGTGGVLNWNAQNSQVGVGYHGTGTLRIADGVTVSSMQGYLGYLPGSSGTAVVTGPGSTWNCVEGLWAGAAGSGTLRVENGGKVVSGKGFGFGYDQTYPSYVGKGHGASGTVVVTGPGSSWAYAGVLYIGYAGGTGSLRVENGGTASGSMSYGRGICLGSGANSSGALTVTGPGSTWTDSQGLVVGHDGSGTLDVANGGTVTCNSACYLGFNAGSSGTATVTGAGSTLTCSDLHVTPGSTLTVADGGMVTAATLYARAGDLRGDGTINAKGLVADMDLVFDAAHATSPQSFGSGGVLNLDTDGTTSLGLGYYGAASLRVADGAKVVFSTNYLGDNAGSSCTAVITGVRSNLASSGSGYVGYSGDGGLTVADGGTFSCAQGYLAYKPGSHGVATVTGSGSTWTNSSYLYIGGEPYNSGGIGNLTVANGGKVMASIVNINSGSAVNLHVSGDGMVVLANGIVFNSGQVNFCANAFLPAGTYLPITDNAGRAPAMSGTGSYNAFGGAWDDSAKTFTVAAAATSGSGVANTLTTGERLLITDSATGQRVGASFGGVADGTNFSAVPLSGTDLSGLPAGQSVLGAWGFTTNYTGGEALLSFDIGVGQLGDLAVWGYDGATWTPFAAPDLTYGDDGIADFSVTGFSGYAITTAVPEPASMTLLALGGLALLRRRK